jgi:hypothetical protein
MDLGRAFTVNNGIELLDDNVNIINLFPLPVDPSVAGFSAPLGSTVFCNASGNVGMWQKTGAGDSDWTKLDISSGTLTPATHKILDQLVHGISEDSYEEWVYTGSIVDSIIIWVDNTKAVKIREFLYTYSAGKVSVEVIKQYDDVGVLVETQTNTYTYSGNFVSYVDVVKS